MVPKHTPDDEHFISIGGYRTSDAERLFEALTEARIEFRAHFNDGIFPGIAQHSFGQYARVRIFVDRDKVAEVTKIQTHFSGAVQEFSLIPPLGV